eukprot:PhM_4_TR4456/c0_g1_i1/m.79052/K02888/RP-L21, MRPL21, rplU; large subunit ribosomal protein L21
MSHLLPYRAALIEKHIAGKPLFAVVAYGLEQYRMARADVVMLPRMKAKIGEEVVFKKVLLCGGETFTAVGRPLLDNVRVHAVVEEQKKAHNVMYYRDIHLRKNVVWRNTEPHITIVRVLDVVYEDPEIVARLHKYDGTLLRGDEDPGLGKLAADGLQVARSHDSVCMSEAEVAKVKAQTAAMGSYPMPVWPEQRYDA